MYLWAGLNQGEESHIGLFRSHPSVTRRISEPIPSYREGLLCRDTTNPIPTPSWEYSQYAHPVLTPSRVRLTDHRRQLILLHGGTGSWTRAYSHSVGVVRHSADMAGIHVLHACKKVKTQFTNRLVAERKRQCIKLLDGNVNRLKLLFWYECKQTIQIQYVPETWRIHFRSTKLGASQVQEALHVQNEMPVADWYAASYFFHVLYTTKSTMK